MSEFAPRVTAIFTPGRSQSCQDLVFATSACGASSDRPCCVTASLKPTTSARGGVIAIRLVISNLCACRPAGSVLQLSSTHSIFTPIALPISCSSS